MISEAKKDVSNVVQEAISAIREGRYSDLHAISDHTLHTITIYQDRDVIDVAVAIYALDKILEKEKYAKHPKIRVFTKTILLLLRDAQNNLQKNDYISFAGVVKELLENIQDFSKSIKFYIDDVLHFARIKKGTKLYEHGLSLGKAAELVGVAKWDLMPAIGETAIHEKPVAPREANKKRLALVEKIFRARKGEK